MREKQQRDTLQRGSGERVRGLELTEVTDALGKTVSVCFVWLIICSSSQQNEEGPVGLGVP